MKHPAQPQLQPNKPQTTNQTQNTTQKTSSSEFGAHKTPTTTTKEKLQHFSKIDQRYFIGQKLYLTSRQYN
jgi:hypothetical protein